MSAVEQARKELFLAISSCMLGGSSLVTLAERLDAAVDNYRTAVRAERDAAWREGMEVGKVAEGGHLPECAKETQGARYCDCGAWGARHAHNAALAALAARMEAK